LLQHDTPRHRARVSGSTVATTPPRARRPARVSTTHKHGTQRQWRHAVHAAGSANGRRNLQTKHYGHQNTCVDATQHSPHRSNSATAGQTTLPRTTTKHSVRGERRRRHTRERGGATQTVPSSQTKTQTAHATQNGVRGETPQRRHRLDIAACQRQLQRDAPTTQPRRLASEARQAHHPPATGESLSTVLTVDHGCAGAVRCR
jgi:hypothetical protein